MSNMQTPSQFAALVEAYTRPTTQWASSVTAALEVLDASVSELLGKVNRLNEELAELRDGLLEVSERVTPGTRFQRELRAALRPYIAPSDDGR